jgi:riboflavin synthase alpha subunit
MSTLLEVNKVVKQYGDVALNEVSLTVPMEVFTDFWVQTVPENIIDSNNKSNYFTR